MFTRENSVQLHFVTRKQYLFNADSALQRYNKTTISQWSVLQYAVQCSHISFEIRFIQRRTLSSLERDFCLYHIWMSFLALHGADVEGERVCFHASAAPRQVLSVFASARFFSARSQFR